MLIRHATAADLAVVVEIYNQAIPGRLATADTEAIAPESRRAWLAEHQPDRYPLWLAEADGQAIGWLSLQPFYGRPAYRATAEVSLYVANQWQQRGVGRSLLERAIARSPDLGLRTLLAFIFAHNTASLKLFEKFRFLERGYLPQIAELDGQECDLTILARRLQF